MDCQALDAAFQIIPPPDVYPPPLFTVFARTAGLNELFATPDLAI